MTFSLAEWNSRPVWIAVNAHPNRERTAEQNLRNQDYRPYCPVIRKQMRVPLPTLMPSPPESGWPLPPSRMP